MALLKNTVIQGQLFVGGPAQASSFVENNVPLVSKYLGITSPAVSVKDVDSGYAITLKYSGNDYKNNASYIAVWDGYRITYAERNKLTIGYAEAPSGFTHADSISWGTLKGSDYTYRNRWDTPAGGSIAFADKGSQTCMQIDGDIYVQEGVKKVATESWVTDTALAHASNRAKYLQYNDNGLVARAENSNEFNLYSSGDTWINYLGSSSTLNIGNGNKALGTLKAATIYEGDKSLANKYQEKGDYLSTTTTTAQSLSSNLTVNWLQINAYGDLGSAPTTYPVFRSDGWIYSRTTAEMKSDLGINGKSSSTHTHSATISAQVPFDTLVASTDPNNPTTLILTNTTVTKTVNLTVNTGKPQETSE